jgi:hypothetical protein
VLFEPGGQGDSKAATVNARVGMGVRVGVDARDNEGMIRRMDMRGRGRCIFEAMMSYGRCLIVWGEMEFGDVDMKVLKVGGRENI